MYAALCTGATTRTQWGTVDLDPFDGTNASFFIRTQDTFLRAAARAFSESGFRAASTREIATRAGVSTSVSA